MSNLIQPTGYKRNTMKKQDINLEYQGFFFNATEKKAGQHYKFLMELGRVFPTTAPQSRYFIDNNLKLDVLNRNDVDRVEALLNEFGFEGDYRYTSTKRWVRLVNHDALYKALEAKYNI